MSSKNDETKRYNSSEVNKKNKKTKKESSKGNKKKSRIGKVIKILVIILLLALIIGSGAVIGVFYGMFGDELKIEKGNHVAIIGGSILANVIAQLVMYYQSVPIMIDNNEKALEIAHKTNVYYLLKNDKMLESEILSITGGRKCSKVIFVTDCDLNVDLIDKVARENATVAITGISITKQKLSTNFAFEKELDVKFIKNAFDNIDASINLIAQKAIRLNYFKLPCYKFEYVQKHFENALNKLESDNFSPEFIIDML